MSNQPIRAGASAHGNLIPFPTYKIDTTYLTREGLRNFCYKLCGRFEAVADSCFRGDADEVKIIETLEKSINEIRERRQDNG